MSNRGELTKAILIDTSGKYYDLEGSGHTDTNEPVKLGTVQKVILCDLDGNPYEI